MDKASTNCRAKESFAKLKHKFIARFGESDVNWALLDRTRADDAVRILREIFNDRSKLRT